MSQWRGYGNNGYGYAIGFRRKDLIFPGFRMVRCIYKEEEKDPVRATILNTCREVGEQEKTDANERILANIEALNNAVANALALKHEGFSEEREWRLVGHSTDSCPLKFRTRKNRVVCYCELPLPPITRIFLGPCQDCDAEQVARKACESLLGYIPPIKPSQIPYRI